MTRLFLIGLLTLSLASCGVARNIGNTVGVGQGASKRTTVEGNGTRFRARANVQSGDRRAVTITVTPVAADPDGAKEAGRYQATRYCLLTYGGSDTEWTIGPDQPIEELPVENDTLTLEGRCTQK
ncbi:hypothetical protein AIOL_002808 [Candidatus Rhodobacter oscarellae]|uniref:Lipoprotein n=1 Tax=Candidatus Rhodobacter oscarellae TaxID=1675527 RepID=A0A0J9E4W4_9RHOB|nr:hypothetical protein [Candidatus Rhodobacter lobularis]KMW57840.1 hypothetical protein AIOL_002808 [Candidatus Rhodobacter lobularis]